MSAPRTSHARQAREAAAHATVITRVVEEACNGGNLAIVDEAVVPLRDADATGAQSLLPLRQYLAAFRAAVPDARWTIVQQIAAGDTVVTRLAAQGTFAGPLVGLARPGRMATVTGVTIARFDAGRLVEVWLQADLLDFMQQLHVLPPLRLAQAVTLAQVLQAGALLADELAAAPPRSPPRTPAETTDAPPEHPGSRSRRTGGPSATNRLPERN